MCDYEHLFYCGVEGRKKLPENVNLLSTCLIYNIRIRKTSSQMMTQRSGFMEINYFVIYTHTYIFNIHITEAKFIK